MEDAPGTVPVTGVSNGVPRARCGQQTDKDDLGRAVVISWLGEEKENERLNVGSIETLSP